ncbi:MFS transporter [Bifidobacterium sp. 82T24]|uniref:MFS transporter n=1 Tax=Bifidobacterium pluvialisilvae TaxID=2834436 RepID=UPI001C5982BF|nr:MFS transporter [Bifidobacterium pluvialisilvae]MBW3088502.1 MFS transporter [Bifidobacterium pluvialisilvae]
MTIDAATDVDTTVDAVVATASEASEPTLGERTTADLIKAAVSGWLGTALEFMDFQLYSLAAALVFKDIFFGHGSAAVAIMSAMAVYGVGYVARPIGAWYFGRLGDRIGRTKVLFITIAIMGCATTLIGALPTFDQVGLLAPALLVVLRLAQGFGAGAEIAGSSVLLAEYAPRKHRGIVSAFTALGTNSGTLMAGAIWAVLLAWLGNDAVVDWGWRIPFLGSVIVMGAAVFIRIHLKETPVYEASVEETIAGYDKPLNKTADAAAAEARKEAERKAAAEIAKTPRSLKAFLVACVLRFGQCGTSAMVQTYLITFMTANLLVSKSVASSVVVYSSLVGFLTVPLIGWLGDIFGRKRMYMIVTIVDVFLLVPCFLLMANNLGSQTTMEQTSSGLVPHFSNPDLLFFVGYIVLHNLAVLSLASLENLTMAECFGSAHRYEQLALSKEIPNLVAGGFGPLTAAALVTAFGGSWIAIAAIMAVCLVLTFLAAVVMPEVAGRDLTTREDAM